MSLPVKLDTNDFCGSHGSSARVLVVGNYSGIAFPKIWPCGGAAHVSEFINYLCVCVHIYMYIFQSLVLLRIPTPGSTSNLILNTYIIISIRAYTNSHLCVHIQDIYALTYTFVYILFMYLCMSPVCMQVYTCIYM